MTGRDELGFEIEAVLEHEYKFAWKIVSVRPDDADKVTSGILYCHEVGGVEMTFNGADAVHNLIIDLFTAAIHDFRHRAGGRFL